MKFLFLFMLHYQMRYKQNHFHFLLNIQQKFFFKNIQHFLFFSGIVNQVPNTFLQLRLLHTAFCPNKYLLLLFLPDLFIQIMYLSTDCLRQILLINTPRDYYLPLAFNGEMDKLTHAGLYGVQETMAVLDNLYGTETAYYGRINFWGLIDIVDALGGIDVYSDYAFDAAAGDVEGYGYRSFSFSEGWNHLEGQEALAFSRERYAFSDGDNQRGKNQMAVIQAIISKASSPAVLKNYQTLLSSLSDAFITSLSYDDIASLVQM